MQSNNKFTTQFGLNNKVEIIVPTTIGAESITDNSAYVKHVMEILALTFGGSSAYEQKGAWISDESGDMIEERSTVVYAYASDLNDDNMNTVYELAEEICRMMSQECVAVTVNSTMYFVEYDVEVAV